MNKILLALVIVLISSCKKDTVDPTGSLKIVYVNHLNLSTGGPYYNLYSDLSYARGNALLSGTMQPDGKDTYQITLTDLNPGNYVITAQGGTSMSSREVQITAGRERDYTF